MKRKSDDLTKMEFPKVFDFIDTESFSEKVLRRHLKTHSYMNMKYICGDCEFLAEDKFSLELHSHLTKNHRKHIQQTTIKHIQMDRKNSDKAANKEFRGSYFF